jgi:hypothetical protein
MPFPIYDIFETPKIIKHAISVLREAIPADCNAIKVELDDRGAALVTGLRRDGGSSDVVLSDDAMAAAGMLMTVTSYQVIVLTRKYREQGEAAVDAAQNRLRASLREAGLTVGLLTETLDDSITIIRH